MFVVSNSFVISSNRYSNCLLFQYCIIETKYEVFCTYSCLLLTQYRCKYLWIWLGLSKYLLLFGKKEFDVTYFTQIPFLTSTIYHSHDHIKINKKDRQTLLDFACGWRQGVNFTNILPTAFTLVDPESVKNTVKSSVSFYAFRICACKSCT